MARLAPESFALGRVPWQFFGSLTFKKERVPNWLRRSMSVALLRDIAGVSGVHFNRLLWCIREERGERFGRVHLHYLLGGLPVSSVSISECFRQAGSWLKLGGGWARVYVYQDDLDGVTYVIKGMDAGMSHETGKFCNDCNLTLSKSLMGFSSGRLGVDRRASNTAQHYPRVQMVQPVNSSEVLAINVASGQAG